MEIPQRASVHYRTRFYLPVAEAGGNPDAADLADRARSILRAWALSQFPDEAEELAPARFRQGRTNLISIRRHGLVETTRLEPEAPGESEIWAFQAKLPDPQVRSREWAHEVAIGPAGSEGLRVSVRVHNWLEVGEVGWSPPRPEAGPPGYVLDIAALGDGRVTDGRDPLSAEPRLVAPGDGPAFVERLADPDRRVAVVYVSVPGPDGKPLIDPAAVARAVAFEADVCVATSPDLDAELDHYLCQHVRCYGGALRMYRPGVKTQARDRQEGERHRYIPRGRLVDTRLPDLLAEIAGEVVHSVAREHPDREPVTFEEIDAVRRRRELASLREETKELERRSRGGLSAEDARRLFQVNERLEERLRSLEEDNARLARRAYHASERLEEERESGSAVGGAAGHGEVDVEALTAALHELPSTPAQTLELAALLYPQRMKITDRARHAAVDAPTDDAAMAWRLLVAMAEDLHSLHFGEGADERSPIEIRDAFGDRTRFEVAFTESKATKASSRLRSLRTMTYDGEDVELLWHVKWGARPPKLLRVYYHPDPRRELLVIDWFGDHLETAGTRRM